MSDNSITKNKSLFVKGIAIILMINHHLFAFQDRIKKVSYISIFKIEGIPIEYYFAEISKICVSMFLFLGGYALFQVYKNGISFKNILKRVYKLYLSYWTVFLVFILMGILLGKINSDLKVILLNFIGISSSLNPEWWFFEVYILLILCYPIIRKVIFKYSSLIVLSVSLFIYCIGTLAIVFSYSIGIVKYEFLFNVMNCQFVFILGSLIAKEGIFDKIKIYINRKYQYGLIILISIVSLLVFPIKTLAYTIITPILIFSLAGLINNSKLIKILGKYSMNMWLIHSFFCYYYFQKLTFAPKYSILILIWIIVLSLGSAILIEKLKIYIKQIIYITVNKLNYNRELNNNYK